ncbi:hypothetical protein H072_7716 [Dactylellina haptotyla CBS 200.50]|uniref:Apple domain-containing protein n=1 Tax=Dactylellina haptotyla (strain CBS 200.50) TaxID=1284197 RepID=S8ABU5_DACHA|nr:hypothetical protein H072_7716 [Dactylellina haptotyla CBS 200.50]
MHAIRSLFVSGLLLQICSASVIPSGFVKKRNDRHNDWPYGYCKNDRKVNSCISEVELIWKELAKVFCNIYVHPTTKTCTTTVKSTKTLAGNTDAVTVTVVDTTNVIVETATAVTTVLTETITDISLIPATATQTNVIVQSTRPFVELITFTVTPNPIISLPITLTLAPLLTSIPTITVPGLPTIVSRAVEKFGYFQVDAPGIGAKIRRRNENHGSDWHGYDGSYVSKACSCIIGSKPVVTKFVTTTKTKTVDGPDVTITATDGIATDVTSTTTEVDEATATTDITVSETTTVDTVTVDTTTTATATVTDYETLDIFQPTACIQYTAAQANPSQIYTDLQTTFALDTTDEFDAIMMCSQACFNQAAMFSQGNCKAFNIFRSAGFDTYFCTVKIAASNLTTDFSQGNFLGISDSQIFSSDTVACPVPVTTV